MCCVVEVLSGRGRAAAAAVVGLRDSLSFVFEEGERRHSWVGGWRV